MVQRRRKMQEAAEEAGAQISGIDQVKPGTVIHVSWGEELFAPVQFNSFRVGGHSITVTVQPDETVREAYGRAWAMLEDLAELQFADKVNGFAKRLNRSKGR